MDSGFDELPVDFDFQSFGRHEIAAKCRNTRISAVTEFLLRFFHFDNDLDAGKPPDAVHNGFAHIVSQILAAAEPMIDSFRRGVFVTGGLFGDTGVADGAVKFG